MSSIFAVCFQNLVFELQKVQKNIGFHYFINETLDFHYISDAHQLRPTSICILYDNFHNSVHAVSVENSSNLHTAVMHAFGESRFISEHYAMPHHVSVYSQPAPLRTLPSVLSCK
ncbi:hypothetical protein Trydic_g9550 [Trypoxylus dichotomus]